MKHIITYQIVKKNNHGLDHLPIKTTITIQIPKTSPTSAYNYTTTNWKELNNKAPIILLDLIATTSITCKDIDNFTRHNFTRHIVGAIKKAVDEVTPHKKPCSYNKR